MARKKRKGVKPKPKPAMQAQEETAGHSRIVQKPHNFEKAILAAYFLGVGCSIRAAARNADMSPETLGGWVKSPWWKEAELVAHRRWLDNVRAKTRGAMLKSLRGGPDRGQMARFVAERMMPEFAPPRQRHQINLGELTVAQLQDQLPEALKVLGLAGSTQKLLEAKLNDGDQSVQPGDETQAEVGEALGVHADSDDD